MLALSLLIQRGQSERVQGPDTVKTEGEPTREGHAPCCGITAAGDHFRGRAGGQKTVGVGAGKGVGKWWLRTEAPYMPILFHCRAFHFPLLVILFFFRSLHEPFPLGYYSFRLFSSVTSSEMPSLTI